MALQITGMEYTKMKKLAADAKQKEALAEYLPRVSFSGTLDNNLRVQQSIDELKAKFSKSSSVPDTDLSTI